MADFITCSNNFITCLTLLRGLFAADANEVYGLRVVEKTMSEGDVITCSTHEEFEQLFKKAIEIADDNKPALRVCMTAKANGVGLVDANLCDEHKSMELLSRLVFVYDTNGDVAVNLWSIT